MAETSSTNTPSSLCPKCGAAIPPEAPQGLCPKCLLQQASLPTETGAGSPTRHTRPAPPDRDELARAFPHLQILELIGQGGMGFVYKARQPKLDRLVALKILAQPLAEQTAFAERFTREGRTLAKLNHPNIVTIHDFGQAGPFFYLLMEYVDGVNLRQAMRAGAINSTQALAIVPLICDALQYAHNEGILHRDIKPDNILLDTRGRIKIADFGIAKLLAEAVAENPLTGAGATLGTPHYMAPEQIEKPNAVDHRADIYSLGVVFYEMLTGELPLGRFAAPSATSGNDPRLDEIVFQTLEKQPDRRPQSASEVGARVETISTTTAPSPAKSVRPALYIAAVGAIVTALTLGVVLLANFLRLDGLERPASENAKEEPAPSTSGPSRKLQITSVYHTNNLTMTVISATEPNVDERFVPVIRYGNGPWSDSEATATKLRWIRNADGIHHAGVYTWRTPEPFSAFEMASGAVRARSRAQQGPIIIWTNHIASIFEITNTAGQSVSGGLRLQKLHSITPSTNPVATIKQLTGGFNSYNGWHFSSAGYPEIPAGFRIQPILRLGNKEIEISTHVSEGWQSFIAPLPAPLEAQTLQNNSYVRRDSVQIHYGAPVEFFVSPATKSGERLRASLELVPLPGVVPPKITARPAEILPVKDLIFGNTQTIGLQTLTMRAAVDLALDETVFAVIQVNDGNWVGDQTSIWESQRGPANQRFAEFKWTFPEVFNDMEIGTAARNFLSAQPTRRITVALNEATPLLTAKNALGQTVTCGLWFKKGEAQVKDPAVAAIITRFLPAPGSLNRGARIRFGMPIPDHEKRPSAFTTHFALLSAPGVRVEAFATAGDQQAPAAFIRNLNPGAGDNWLGSVSCAWDYPFGFHTNVPPTDALLKQIESGNARITFDKPFEVFAITNGAGQVFRGFLEATRLNP